MKLKKAEDNHKKMETAFLKLETEKNLLVSSFLLIQSMYHDCLYF